MASEPPRDLLAGMKKERDKIEEEMHALEAQIEELEPSTATKLEALETKWQDKIDIEVDRQIRKREKEIRQKAIAQSRAGQLGKTLEKVVPMFPGLVTTRTMCDQYSIRSISLYSMAYYQGSVTDICFVEFKTGKAE